MPPRIRIPTYELQEHVPFCTWDMDSAFPSCTWWHGSTFEIEDFLPYSHFGTLPAACTAPRRKSDNRQAGADNSDMPCYLYPVFLKITSPLEADDPGDDHTPEVLVNVVFEALLQTSISRWRRWALARQKNDFAHTLKTAREDVLEKLTRLLLNYGYDGLTYRLKHEAPGTLAAIILDRRQVRSIFDPDKLFSDAVKKRLSCDLLCKGASAIWLRE